jgi:hypothetical protein
MKFEFLEKFLEKYSNFIQILPVGAELFHAEGQTNRRDEANIRFSLL